jgi:hypothetical protein
MSDALIEFAEREYNNLREQAGRSFFLALAAYTDALRGRAKIAAIVDALEVESTAAANRFVDEENEFIDEAKSIRLALAERAAEIDNSDMVQPDAASHDYWRWDYSLAKFDRLADANVRIAFPTLPRDDDDPGPVSDVISILRERFQVAVHGEEAGVDAVPIRDDLDDLAARIRNLGERHRASLQRFRQESRTLAGLSYSRLAYFGSDLVADPIEVNSNEDLGRLFELTLQQYGDPKRMVRALVNGDRLDDAERGIVDGAEATLRAEAERLNSVLVRRLDRDRTRTERLGSFLAENTRVVVTSTVIGVAVVAVSVYLGLR